MPQRTIFVAHYDKRHLESVENALESEGFSIHTFADGESILVAAAELAPDVVVVEAMLPRRNGFEVCRSINSGMAGRKIPVVITSSVLQGTRYRDEAITSYGCVDFLGRGSEIQDLVRVLEAIPIQESDVAAPGSPVEPRVESADGLSGARGAGAAPSAPETIVAVNADPDPRGAQTPAAEQTPLQGTASIQPSTVSASSSTSPASPVATVSVESALAGPSALPADSIGDLPEILSGDLDEEALVEALDEIFEGTPSSGAGASAETSAAAIPDSQAPKPVEIALLDPEPQASATEDGARTMQLDEELADALRAEFQEIDSEVPDPSEPGTAELESNSTVVARADTLNEPVVDTSPVAETDPGATAVVRLDSPPADASPVAGSDPGATAVIKQDSAPAAPADTSTAAATDSGVIGDSKRSVVETISPRSTAPPETLFEQSLEMNESGASGSKKPLFIALAAAGILVAAVLAVVLVTGERAPLEQQAGPRISRASTAGGPSMPSISQGQPETAAGAGYLLLPGEGTPNDEPSATPPGDAPEAPEAPEATKAIPSPGETARPPQKALATKPDQARPVKRARPAEPAEPAAPAAPVRTKPRRPAAAPAIPVETAAPSEPSEPIQIDPKPAPPVEPEPVEAPARSDLPSGGGELSPQSSPVPAALAAPAAINPALPPVPAGESTTIQEDPVPPTSEPTGTDIPGSSGAPGSQTAPETPDASSPEPPATPADSMEDMAGPESEAGTGTGFSYPTQNWGSTWENTLSGAPAEPVEAVESAEPAGFLEEPQSSATGDPVAENIPEPGAPVDVQPRATAKLPPDFPTVARERGEQGRVILQVLVLDTGEVGRVRVIESPFEMLAEAAVIAALEWKYDPARRDGNPVSAWTTESVNFRIR